MCWLLLIPPSGDTENQQPQGIEDDEHNKGIMEFLFNKLGDKVWEAHPALLTEISQMYPSFLSRQVVFLLLFHIYFILFLSC